MKEKHLKNIQNSKVVAFGDSITLGIGAPEDAKIWPEILKERFKLEIYNAGVGGNTSSQGLERIYTDVVARRPDFVTISFGMNDHCMSDIDKQHVKPDEFKKNLCKMIEIVRNNGAVPFLVTTNYIIEGDRKSYYYSRRDPDFYKNVGGAQCWLDTYVEITRKTAIELKVGLADVRKACEEYDRYDFLRSLKNDKFDDGVHPHALGQLVYAETVGGLFKNFNQ